MVAGLAQPGAVPSGESGTRSTEAGRASRGIHGRLDHGYVAAVAILSGKAVRESRDQWANDVTDAGALSSGCGGSETASRCDSCRYERHRREYGTDFPGGDSAELRDNDGFGAHEWNQGRIVIHLAGSQLHAEIQVV